MADFVIKDIPDPNQSDTDEPFVIKDIPDPNLPRDVNADVAKYFPDNPVWTGIGAGVDALVNAAKHPISTANQIAGDVIGAVTLGTVTPRTGTINVPITGKPIAKIMPETEKLQDIEPFAGETIGTMLPWIGASKVISSGVNALKGTAPTLRAVKTGAQVAGEAAERAGIQAATGATIGAAQPATNSEERIKNIVNSAEFGAFMSVGTEAAFMLGSKIAQIKQLPAKMKVDAWQKLQQELSDLLYENPEFKNRNFNRADADAMAAEKIRQDINKKGGWTKTSRSDFRKATNNVKKARQEQAKANEPVEPEIVQEGPQAGVEAEAPDIADVKIRNLRKAVKQNIKETADAEAIQQTETGTVTTESLPEEEWVPVTRGVVEGKEGFQSYAGSGNTWFISGHGKNAEAAAMQYAVDAAKAEGGVAKIIKGWVRMGDIQPHIATRPMNPERARAEGNPIEVRTEGLKDGGWKETVYAKEQTGKATKVLSTAKEPVTFIGMQEIGKGRPALTLVNNKEGSTVTFKPESMEITNPEKLPETSELKISNNSEPVSLESLTAYHESLGLSPEQARSVSELDMEEFADNPETAPKTMEEFKKLAAEMQKEAETDSEAESDLAVAIRTKDGEIIVGDKNDTHISLVNKQVKNAPEKIMDGGIESDLWVDKNTGKVYTREEALALKQGTKTTVEDGKLHSVDLMEQETESAPEVDRLARIKEIIQASLVPAEKAIAEIDKELFTPSEVLVPSISGEKKPVSMKESAIEHAVIAARNGSPMQSIVSSGQFNDKEIDRLNNIIAKYGQGITASDIPKVVKEFFSSPSVREQKLAKVKKSKPKKLSVETSSDKYIPSDEVRNTILESTYESQEQAELALEVLGANKGKYQITNNNDMYIVEEKDSAYDPMAIVTSDTQYQTLESAQAVPRDTSNLVSATRTMLSDVNIYLHTGQGDIVSIAKQLGSLLQNIESNPRMFLKEFNNDLSLYNDWVSSLNNLAGYIIKVKKATGPTMDFMGFQNAWNQLVRIRNRMKARIAFRKQHEIQMRVSGRNELINIQSGLGKDISILGNAFSPSMLTLSKNFPQDAREIVIDTIQAEQWNYIKKTEDRHNIKQLESNYSNNEIAELTELGYHIYDYSQKMRAYLRKQGAHKEKIEGTIRANVEEYLAEQNPKIVDGYRQVRQTYDAWQEEYKDHLIKELNTRTPDNIRQAATDYAGHLDIARAFNDNGITSNHDKFKVVDYMTELYKISDWGDEDYVTHLMYGDIGIYEEVLVREKDGSLKYDKDNNVVMHKQLVTIGRSVDDAFEKALDYANSQYEDNKSVGKFFLEHSFVYDGDMNTMLSARQFKAYLKDFNTAVNSATRDLNDKSIAASIKGKMKHPVGKNPASVWAPFTMKTKHVLPGENDVFQGMRMYSNQLRKKIAYDPVINRQKRELSKFPPNVQRHLRKVLASSKGDYTLGNQVMDDIIDKWFYWLGIEGRMSYNRYVVNPMTKFVINAKLGYRWATGAFNYVDGHSRYWLQFREHYFKEAMKFLRTPEGKALVERQGWSLGARFDEIESGHIRSKQAKLKELAKPLGVHTYPELGIREHNYAAAYLFYRDQRIAELKANNIDPNIPEVLEESENFAKRSAMVNVWELQGSGTRAEKPEILRWPTARMFGVFFQYPTTLFHFIMANRSDVGFWARWIPFQMMTVGPRGFWAMLKSLPLIETIMALAGAGYMMDRIDQWMMTHIPGSGGLPSFAGLDTVAPATAQFPGSSSTIDTIVKTYKTAYNSIGNPNARYETKEGIKQTILFARNWWDIVDSMVDENGFVLGPDGKPKYTLDNWYDRGAIFLGVTPENKRLEMLTKSIARKREQIEQENIKRTTRAFVNVLQGFHHKGADLDAVVDKALEIAKNGALKHHITADQLKNACKDMRMSPSVRTIVNTKVLNRLDTMMLYQDAEQKNPNILFPQE